MNSKTRTYLYWGTLGLFAFALTGSGTLSVLGVEQMVDNITGLGFPAWFVTWLGAFKLMGVAVLLAPGLPRLKEWSYAGFTINLLSAAAAHLAAGDSLGEAAPPLVLLTMALVSWAMRPESRRLADAGAATDRDRSHQAA